MKIEMGKKYKTKRGDLVRQILRVGSLTSTMYPVIVEMENGDVQSYTSEGGYFHNTAFPSGRDLVEVCEWDDFKIDDKVMVRNDLAGVWFRKHFAGVDELNGKPTTYTGGRSSHTEAKGNPAEVWDECRKPTEEELK